MEREHDSHGWTRRAVQSALTNPFYAGRVAYYRGTGAEQIVDVEHLALVAPRTLTGWAASPGPGP